MGSAPVFPFMTGRGDKKPAASAPPRKGGSPHGSACGNSSQPQKQGVSTFSPSVSSKHSLQKFVTPVQPQKSVDSRSSQCSTGSDSGAAPFDICMSANKCTVKLKPSILETTREKRRDRECSKDVAPLHLRPGMECSTGSDSGAAPFDICMSANKCTVKLKPSILETTREKRRDRECSKDVAPLHLRPGMVLLKRFIKPDDQVKIVKLCRQLGVGPGGFYRPGYRNGAMLRLWMMCLGKNWDPDSYSYGDRRPFDGAQPPIIPEELKKFVQDGIQASNKFLKQQKGAANAVQEIPVMSPDICLVNFYNSSGRLGLHQDKDESESSIGRGLPVVSFSIGETTEFLYGDVRDEEKLSKVDLESGDVLIFGGKSRLIFHGVSNTKPKTAPKWLTDETSLRPGRLNLTFRQY